MKKINSSQPKPVRKINNLYSLYNISGYKEVLHEFHLTTRNYHKE